MAERLEDWVHVRGAMGVAEPGPGENRGKATMAELPVNPWLVLVPVADGEW